MMSANGESSAAGESLAVPVVAGSTAAGSAVAGSAAAPATARGRVAGLEFDRLSEAAVVGCVIGASQRGRGGWIATPNIDICRMASRDPALRDLVGGASLVGRAGVPLLWAARLRGDPLAGRVAGASLIFSLSAAAARHGLPVYLLGGEPGVPDRAGVELGRRFPGLVVAGAY